MSYHPSISSLLSFFEYEHLPDRLRDASRPFCELAQTIAYTQAGPEAAACLRKLLEAKDCAVRCEVQKINRERSNPQEGQPVEPR